MHALPLDAADMLLLRNVLITFTLFILMSGCSSLQTDPPERNLPFIVPTTWEALSGSKASDKNEAHHSVEQYFGIHFPGFNYSPLILNALQGNYALHQLEIQLNAQKAKHQLEKSRLWPSITAGLDGQDTHIDNSSTALFALQGNVSWTVDLWGSQNLLSQAAKYSLEEASLSWNAAQLSVAAAALQNWFDWQTRDKLHQLQEDFVRTLETTSRLVENRFDTGLASFLEVRLAHTEIALARTDLLQRKTAEITARSKLISLLGENFSFLELFSEKAALQFNNKSQTTLPERAQALPTYLPADIIRKRPDLLAAERHLKSEELKLLSNKKAWLPSLNLTASTGRQNDSLSNLLKNGLSVSAIAFNLMQPIFNAGAIKAQQAQASASVSRELYVYSELLHKAMVEVNQFFQQDTTLEKQLKAAKFAAGLADETQTLARRDYNAGLINLNTFLDTHRNRINTESRLLSSRNDWLQNRINLLLALSANESLFFTHHKDNVIQAETALGN